jgi:hypothetical protein
MRKRLLLSFTKTVEGVYLRNFQFNSMLIYIRLEKYFVIKKSLSLKKNQGFS